MNNLESLLEKESQARAALTDAENRHKEAVLAVRAELGNQLRKERERAGLSVFHLSSMLGVCRAKVFNCENPDKVSNHFSIQTLMELVRAVKKVADFCESSRFNPGKRGRPPGAKNSK